MKGKSKVVKFARAFAMHRCKLGLVVEEQLLFALTDDEEKTYELIRNFAEEHKCEVVEVWYREDTRWDECKFYKTYNFYPTLTDEQFNRMDIYAKK